MNLNEYSSLHVSPTVLRILLNHVFSGKDVHLDTLVPFQSRVIGRVRMGHVLFAECGNAKVMCKEQRLGAGFHVVANELHVGDTLYCLGYPGFEYKCEAVIFAQQILAIEPGAPSDEKQAEPGP